MFGSWKRREQKLNYTSIKARRNRASDRPQVRANRIRQPRTHNSDERTRWTVTFTFSECLHASSSPSPGSQAAHMDMPNQQGESLMELIPKYSHCKQLMCPSAHGQVTRSGVSGP